MKSLLKLPLLYSTLVASALLPACSMDDGKGEEDDALDVYESKTDSFRSPTEHGSLLFGTAQSARLASGQGFHSWDFVLSDDADVSLETQLVTANLDTVMYLYKKSPETGRYGRFKFKNDDANPDTVSSALSKSLDAGEYRVLIKGFKSSIRGSFEVVAQCDGAGCKQSSCDASVFASLPRSSNDSCGELFSGALNTAAQSSSRVTIGLNERCDLPEFASRAVEHYVSYFGGKDDFNEFFDFGDGAQVDVDWNVYANGTTYISVDGGGDEAALDFLVNPAGQVIAHYQHNQSPDHTLYCDGGEEFLEDGDCFFNYVENFPHAQSDEKNSSDIVKGSDAEAKLGPAAFLAYQLYVSELGLSQAKQVTVDATTWDSGVVGQISVKANGESKFVYELNAEESSNMQYTVKRGRADANYDCKAL